MYGIYKRSMGRRILWQFYHFLLIAILYWFLFEGGISKLSSWFGVSWNAGDLTRRILIFLTSVILFLRWGLTNFYLLKREMPWIEIIIVSIELTIIYFMYAFWGGQVSESIGIIEVIGITFFVIGSYLNTGSEIMRHLWKKDPKNKGKIYDIGLFKYSMHINYFGDLVWSMGMVMIAGNLWLLFIPIYMCCGFVFMHIPRLDNHLRERYGPQYEAYSKRTKKIIPFIY